MSNHLRGRVDLNQGIAETPQKKSWAGDFGREYTERNTLSGAQLDSLYQTNYGITRRQLNETLLSNIPRNARILEVGCNSGNQLLLLQEMGFANLWRAEVQSYALELASARVRGARLSQASALALPYKAATFVLILPSAARAPIP